MTWNYMREAAGGSVMAGTTGFACSSLSVSDWWKVLGKHYGRLLMVRHCLGCDIEK